MKNIKNYIVRASSTGGNTAPSLDYTNLRDACSAARDQVYNGYDRADVVTIDGRNSVTHHYAIDADFYKPLQRMTTTGVAYDGFHPW